MLTRLRLHRPAAAVKHVCRDCEARRALFRYRGVVKWDRYHTLCFQCYRKYANRLRTAVPTTAPLTASTAARTAPPAGNPAPPSAAAAVPAGISRTAVWHPA